VDIDIDGLSNVYACGNTFGTNSAGSYDVIVFMFDSDMVMKWGKVWGASKSETSTSIVADSDSNTGAFVFGYSNSVGELSSVKEDAFIFKVDASGSITI
jgi:hypothetical protein